MTNTQETEIHTDEDGTSFISTFFNTVYINYAVYKVFQRLPHQVDTLGNTQRKIITVLEKISPIRKLKTAEIYSLIYNETKYIHGDASAYSVSESLCRSANNTINILTEEGNFGFRTNTTAAGPRYTNTRLSDVGRLIFRQSDKPLYVNQEFEGKHIEPEFLLPIVPVSVINGFSAISVGYASKFLPRDPNEVIDFMIGHLSSKSGAFSNERINIRFPYYVGSAEFIGDSTKSSWKLYGKINKTTRRRVYEITELPPTYNREIYLKKLKKYQQEGLITKFDEKCVKNKFYFIIKINNEFFGDSPTEEMLIDNLGLSEIFTENIIFVNKNNQESPITDYSSMEDYLKWFTINRQSFYVKRKEYIIMNIERKLAFLENKIHFINKVNTGELNIRNTKKEELLASLRENGFLEIPGEESNFDYLLNIKIWNLTDTYVLKYKEDKKKLVKELKEVKKITPQEMHISELLELKEAIIPELIKKLILL